VEDLVADIGGAYLNWLVKEANRCSICWGRGWGRILKEEMFVC